MNGCPRGAANQQPEDGDRQRYRYRNKERRVANQHPIDDPRREAKQNAHDRSVYGRDGGQRLLVGLLLGLLGLQLVLDELLLGLSEQRGGGHTGCNRFN